MRLAWLILPALWCVWWLRGEHSPPGIRVAESPLQWSANLPEWERSGFRIRALAEYSIRGRILGCEHYWFDGGAKLSPFDLALGWGPMSDQALLDRLYYSQGHRFFLFSAPSGGWPAPFDEINSHSANVHIIPADGQVRGSLEWTRVGRVVKLHGYLVEATCPGARPWRSSLSRTDTGYGACELMWVDQVGLE